jgi:hypothetical protein
LFDLAIAGFIVAIGVWRAVWVQFMCMILLAGTEKISKAETLYGLYWIAMVFTTFFYQNTLYHWASITLVTLSSIVLFLHWEGQRRGWGDKLPLLKLKTQKN